MRHATTGSRFCTETHPILLTNRALCFAILASRISSHARLSMSDPTDPAGMSGDRFFEQYIQISPDAARITSNDAKQAIVRFEAQLSSARSRGDRRSEAQALLGLGAACNYLGEERRALGFLEQSLAVARELGDRCGEERALLCMGDAHN